MVKIREMMKKMLVLGDGAVGKTSLIRRYVYDRFEDKYIATIGTKTSAKTIQISTGQEPITLKLQIWDLLGQKGYKKLHNSSFRGTHGVFMVTDITRKETLLSLENYWIPKMQTIAGNIPFVILANKSDLAGNAEFSRKELKETALKFKVPFYLTSAKSGDNVNQAFHELGKIMVDLKTVEPLKLTKPTVIHPKLLFKDKKGEITRVIDKIIDDFCKAYSDIEDAMPVVRRQFELAELDPNNPTLDALERAVERLAKVEMSFRKKSVVNANLTERLKWIEEIKVRKGN